MSHCHRRPASGLTRRTMCHVVITTLPPKDDKRWRRPNPLRDDKRRLTKEDKQSYTPSPGRPFIRYVLINAPPSHPRLELRHWGGFAYCSVSCVKLFIPLFLLLGPHFASVALKVFLVWTVIAVLHCSYTLYTQMFSRKSARQPNINHRKSCVP